MFFLPQLILVFVWFAIIVYDPLSSPAALNSGTGGADPARLVRIHRQLPEPGALPATGTEEYDQETDHL
jgi:hypothetical protein